MNHLIRRKPFGEMGDVFDSMERTFESMFRDMPRAMSQISLLPLDIYEKDDAFYVRASVPGLREEDLDLTVDKRKSDEVAVTGLLIAGFEMGALDQDEATLKKAFRFSLKGGGLMTLVLIVGWPMPLFFSGYVFDVGFYGLWVGIAVAWVSGATFFIVGLPLIEARHGIAKIVHRQKAVPEPEGR